MAQVFGEFHNESLKSRELLSLGFSSSTPIQQRWRNNGLSADFLADYFSTFFPSASDDSGPNTLKKQAKLKEAVSYIANELLENAMKFNDDSSNYPITIQFQLYSDHLILRVTNSINDKNTTKFQLFLNEFLRNEPQDLFLRQMKAAETDAGMTTSRLGLLTMIDSYNAKLGWQFETSQANPKIVIVTTMAQLIL